MEAEDVIHLWEGAVWSPILASIAIALLIISVDLVGFLLARNRKKQNDKVDKDSLYSFLEKDSRGVAMIFQTEEEKDCFRSLPTTIDPTLLAGCLWYRFHVGEKPTGQSEHSNHPRDSTKMLESLSKLLQPPPRTKDDLIEFNHVNTLHGRLFEWALKGSFPSIQHRHYYQILLLALQRLSTTPRLFHPDEPLPRAVFLLWLQQLVQDHLLLEEPRLVSEGSPEVVADSVDTTEPAGCVLFLCRRLESILLLLNILFVDQYDCYAVRRPVCSGIQVDDDSFPSCDGFSWRQRFWDSLFRRREIDDEFQHYVPRIGIHLGYYDAVVRHCLQSVSLAESYLRKTEDGHASFATSAQRWVDDLQLAQMEQIGQSERQLIRSSMQCMKVALEKRREDSGGKCIKTRIDRTIQHNQGNVQEQRNGNQTFTEKVDLGRAFLVLGAAFFDNHAWKEGLECLEAVFHTVDDCLAWECITSLSASLRYLGLVALCRSEHNSTTETNKCRDPVKERSVGDHVFSIHLQLGARPYISTLVPLLPSLKQSVRIWKECTPSKTDFAWCKLQKQLKDLHMICQLGFEARDIVSAHVDNPDTLVPKTLLGSACQILSEILSDQW
jgi:hypothetical protein